MRKKVAAWTAWGISGVLLAYDRTVRGLGWVAGPDDFVDYIAAPWREYAWPFLQARVFPMLTWEGALFALASITLAWVYFGDRVRVFLKRRTGAPTLPAITKTGGIPPPLASSFVPPQECCALSLANDSDHVQIRKDRTFPASHSIRVIVTPKAPIKQARPRLQNISRLDSGVWHSLNDNHKMELRWSGVPDQRAFLPQDVTDIDYFLLFNYFEEENVLEISPETKLRSFPDSANLPIGSYKLEIRLDYEGGVACRATFIIHWFGKIETLYVEQQP